MIKTEDNEDALSLMLPQNFIETGHSSASSDSPITIGEDIFFESDGLDLVANPNRTLGSFTIQSAHARPLTKNWISLKYLDHIEAIEIKKNYKTNPDITEEKLLEMGYAKISKIGKTVSTSVLLFTLSSMLLSYIYSIHLIHPEFAFVLSATCFVLLFMFKDLDD